MARLTVKSVEAMRAGKTRREVPDAYCPGLYFIVQPSGAKSWAVRYRHAGKTAKLTLGTFPAIDLKTAREQGSKALRAVAEGRDPAAERKKPVASDAIESVVQQFIERRVAKLRPAWRSEAERYLRRVIDAWGGRKISDIRRADIRSLVGPLADNTPIAANRLHSVVRTFFGWALEQDIIGSSPAAGLKPPGGKETSRDRVLSDAELRRVWLAAEQMGLFGAAVKMLILTGQRRGEVAGMRWDELDLAQRLWTLPKKRTKNKREHTVPLSLQAVAIIKSLPRIGDEFVFTFDGDASMNCFSGKTNELRALAGAMPPFVLHDLRRTAASGLARLGVALPVIERVLNHAGGSFAGVVGVYQRHEYAAEKRAALERWAGHVTAIVGGGNVLSLAAGDAMFDQDHRTALPYAMKAVIFP
jgi:integrase